MNKDKADHKSTFLKPLLFGLALIIIVLIGGLSFWVYSYYQDSKFKISYVDYEDHSTPAFYSQDSLQDELTAKGLWINLQSLNENTKASVPAIAYSYIPDILGEMEDSNQLKNDFVSLVLPLVLIANEEIREQRKFVASINIKRLANIPISREEKVNLNILTDQYGCEDAAVGCLLDRIQPVPVTLAVAQSAIESGWGTSRFARQGNALFGQWAGEGSTQTIAARESRDGEEIRLRAFDYLLDSVRAYMLNLNTHPAYKDFRYQRFTFFKGELSFEDLLKNLQAYAEKEDYADLLKNIIEKNNLQHLPRVVLKLESLR